MKEGKKHLCVFPPETRRLAPGLKEEGLVGGFFLMNIGWTPFSWFAPMWITPAGRGPGEEHTEAVKIT
jgi:hypothetical protein